MTTENVSRHCHGSVPWGHKSSLHENHWTRGESFVSRNVPFYLFPHADFSPFLTWLILASAADLRVLSPRNSSQTLLDWARYPLWAPIAHSPVPALHTWDCHYVGTSLSSPLGWEPQESSLHHTGFPAPPSSGPSAKQELSVCGMNGS